MLSFIIAIGIAFALFWTFKNKQPFPSVITLGMIIGTMVLLMSAGPFKSWGLFIYMAFVALAFVYGIVVKNLTAPDRLIVCLMSLSIFAYWLWVLNHWHGFAPLAPMVTLIAAFVALFKKTELRNETGFLAFLSFDALAILVEQMMKAGS
jgi:hypothetical protein